MGETIERDSKSATYRHMQETLSEAGFRMTGSRKALLRLLAETREPLSVQELVEKANATPAAERRRQRRVELAERRGQPSSASGGESAAEVSGEGINVVTVYRLVNLLVEMGLLRRIEFGQGYFRYERAESQDTADHHHHLVCENCGRIEDFHGCADLAPLTERVATESGFSIARHQLELYGTCAACQAPPAPPASKRQARAAAHG